jgi:competence protein ComEA
MIRNVVLAAGILLAAELLFAASTQSGELPEGKGKATVQKVCSGCHEMDTVIATRYTEKGWRQTIDDMISRGAEGSDQDMSDVEAYLTKYFGRLNVNTAPQAQLQEVLDLPEKDAQAIVAYREHNGAIKNFEQLKSIPGVNAEKLQQKSALIAFSQ